MRLGQGQRLRTEILGLELNVVEKLGQGGQAAVFRVQNALGQWALKLYPTRKSTPQQRDSIRKLVATGPPKGLAGERFVWPEDLVLVPASPRFGYVMKLVDRERFANLEAVWAGSVAPPAYGAMCEASRQTADSFGSLHLDGYCYCDISHDNVRFVPGSGDVLIIDNDNVGVDGESESAVDGTMEYMAPEIVVQRAKPSIAADRHSLAVFLFHLWVWHHPLEGLREYSMHVWDVPAKRHVYGENPCFIFDPNDESNRLPGDDDYETARRRWEFTPPSIRKLFTSAFTTGLHDPRTRVTEGQWETAFREARDNSLRCPSCDAENLWDEAWDGFSCWKCREPILAPPRLKVRHSLGVSRLAVTAGSCLLARHLDPTIAGGEQGEDVVGRVVPNPRDPRFSGLRNETESPWEYVAPDGRSSTVAPGRAVPISQNGGAKVSIAAVEIEVIEGDPHPQG